MSAVAAANETAAGGVGQAVRNIVLPRAEVARVLMQQSGKTKPLKKAALVSPPQPPRPVAAVARHAGIEAADKRPWPGR